MLYRLSSLNEYVSSFLTDGFLHANDYQHSICRHSTVYWDYYQRYSSLCGGQSFLDNMVFKGTCPYRSYIKQLRIHHARNQSSLSFPGSTNVGHEPSQVISPHWVALAVVICTCLPELSLRYNCTPKRMILFFHTTSCSPRTIFGCWKDLLSVTSKASVFSGAISRLA